MFTMRESSCLISKLLREIYLYCGLLGLPDLMLIKIAKITRFEEVARERRRITLRKKFASVELKS